MMLSSFHSCFSLLVFTVYGLVFQVHELHSAPLQVMGPPGPVTVAVGEDAVLPCRFSPVQSTQDMEVTWFREQLVPFVHQYKGGRDQNKNQMLEYVGRTELWKDGLLKGSVNLKIFDVQLSDRGNYTCVVVNGADYDEAVVELQVTASGSVPLVALERYQDGGIRVSCRSAGWYPRPQVLWRDPHGQHLPSLSESVTQDQSSLFAVESSIILTRGTKQNVSCWVRHVLDGQERGSEFYISDPFFHNAHPLTIALGIVSVAVIALIIFAVYLFKIKGKHEKQIAMRDAALRDRDAEIGDRDAEIEKQAEELATILKIPLTIALGIISVAVVVLLIFAVYLFKIKGKCEKQIAKRDAALRDRDAKIEKQAEELAWRRYAVPIEKVKVVLDSDTAHRSLVLSDDCKSVKREEKLQDIPDNPKRFQPWRCVLGREGFTSGRCYWEVEVEDGGGWLVGVCREDVKRKGDIILKPEKGFWVVGQWEGRFQALTSPDRTFLSEIQTPKRIRVFLDYKEGQVSFFGVDENIPIFTFQETSFVRKRVYPWFWLNFGAGLKVCP